MEHYYNMEKKELEGEIFEQIRTLHEKGIIFCPVSGRQYTNLRKLFAPVADCCVFLCENGGVIYKDEQCIAIGICSGTTVP